MMEAVNIHLKIMTVMEIVSLNLIRAESVMMMLLIIKHYSVARILLEILVLMARTFLGMIIHYGDFAQKTEVAVNKL